MALKPSEVMDLLQRANEYAASGLSDADISVLLGVGIDFLQQPIFRQDMQRARTQTVATLAAAAVASALKSGDPVEIRQCLKLFGRALEVDGPERRAAPIMITAGSVAAAMAKQREMLADHPFDPPPEPEKPQ